MMTTSLQQIRYRAKPYIPTSLKPAIKGAEFLPRLMTARFRMMPDFIIFGVQKCGTTSLYSYLTAHPSIATAYTKEISFFDDNFEKGTGWYRAHFPMSSSGRPDLKTGEATPCYIFHPQAPERAFSTLPRVKLIALLRNPVDRLYSHYKHSVRLGVEELSLEDAIKEAHRLRVETEDPERNNGDPLAPYRTRAAYLTRGIYVDQLKAWTSLFPREQLLILKSEDVFADPAQHMSRIFEFLGLPDWQPRKYVTYNYGHYEEMDSAARKHLADYFRPHNQRLYEFLGTDYDWDR